MFKEKLNQIRILLGMEVKLADEQLTDGSAISAEKFEVGYPVFTKADDGTQTPATPGTYETASGLVIEVDAEGKIVSVEAKSEEVETEVAVEAAEEVEVEMAAIETPETPEDPIDPAAPEVDAPAQTDNTAILEALSQVVFAVEDLCTKMGTMQTEMTEMKEKYAKFSKLPGGNKIPTITVDESVLSTNSLDAKVEALQKMRQQNFFRAQK